MLELSLNKFAIAPKGRSLPEDIGLEVIYISKVINAIIAAIHSERNIANEDFSMAEDDG